MAGGPIRISVLADTKDLGKSMASAEKTMTSAAAVAEKSAGKIESSFNNAAEGADHVASKGSQAAGALSGLGGLAAMSGGKVGALGVAMTVAGTATQGLADAGDLLNVVTESTIVKNTLARASTIANAAAQTAASAASKTWAAAQWAVNAALSANPIGLVVVAIAALAAGIVLAYKKSDTFRAIVQAAFQGVQTAVSTMWGVAKGILDKLKAAFGAVGSAATGVWHSVQDAFDKIWNKISSLPGKVKGLGNDMLDAGTHMADKLVDGITSIGGQAGDIAKSIVNKVIDFLNSILPHTLNTHIPGVGTVNLIPNIPHLANGGITTGPTLAVIGDNPGGREAVIPLDKYDVSGNNLAAAVDRLAAAYEAESSNQNRRHKQLLGALRQAQADAGAGAMQAVNQATKTAARRRVHRR